MQRLQEQIYFLKIKMENYIHQYQIQFLDGITRRTIIEIAKSKNIEVHERKIKPQSFQILLVVF